MSSRSKKKWKNRMRAELPLSTGPVLENLQEADKSADETTAKEEEPKMDFSDCKNYEVQQNLIPEKKDGDTLELVKEVFEPKETLDTVKTAEILKDNKDAVDCVAAASMKTEEIFPVNTKELLQEVNAMISKPKEFEARTSESEKSEAGTIQPFETKIIKSEESPFQTSDTKTISPDLTQKKKTSGTERTARVERVTKETEIVLELNLDGTGKAKIDTGIGFFDHMLVNMAKHGFLDMKLAVHGDLFVDGHHTIEDTGIVFGQALREALGTKEGIKRYGSFLLPMDETLVLCAVDLSGRPYLNFSAKFTTERVGYMETELVQEFFYAVSYSAGMNLHIKVIDGQNNHHIIEAMFKAFAKALDEAKTVDPRIAGVLSTKGVV